MRAWRLRHPYSVSVEQLRRIRCRDTARAALRLGHLQRKPCEVCGSPDSEKHHDDYDKPLEVRWLCRKHHLAIEGKVARKINEPLLAL